MRRFIPALCVPLLLLSAPARPAAASETFPTAVKEAVPTLPCVPQCTLCHQGNPGMPPANKPFALKLKVSPVGPKDVAALRTALQKLQAAGITSDADGDGKGDYAELELGEDPNSNEIGAALCVTSPLYGCGAATIARTPKNSTDPLAVSAAPLALLAGLWAMRRR